MAKGFTEQAKQAFVQAARSEGLVGAMKLLGYPQSKATASRWVDQYGVEISRSALHKRAAEVKTFYSEHERLVMLQDMLDAIYSHIEKVTDAFGGSTFLQVPDAGELAKLASAAEKTIKMIELLEGRVTERSETVAVDSTDLELRSLIAEAQSEAAAKEAALMEGEDEGVDDGSEGGSDFAGEVPQQDASTGR